MWETRFATPDYVFGTEPAQFLRAHGDLLTPGASALCVADGEGRNSVFMAQRALQVTALEYAPSALAKARRLAEERGVTVDFREVDVLAHDWPDTYDRDRQVVGGLRNDNPDAGSQAAFSSRVMSPQIQWASALA